MMSACKVQILVYQLALIIACEIIVEQFSTAMATIREHQRLFLINVVFYSQTRLNAVMAVKREIL